MVDKKVKTGLAIGGGVIALVLARNYFQEGGSEGATADGGGDVLGGQDALGTGAGASTLAFNEGPGGYTETTTYSGTPEALTEDPNEDPTLDPDVPIPEEETTTEPLISREGVGDFTDAVLFEIGVLGTAAATAAGAKKLRDKIKSKRTTVKLNEDLKAGTNKRIPEAEVKTKLRATETDLPGNIKVKGTKLRTAGKAAGAAGAVVEVAALGAATRERFESDELGTGFVGGVKKTGAAVVDVGADTFGFLTGLVYRPKAREGTTARERQANTGWFATFKDLGQSVRERGVGDTALQASGIRDIIYTVSGKDITADDDEDKPIMTLDPRNQSVQAQMSVYNPNLDRPDLMSRPVRVEKSTSLSESEKASRRSKRGNVSGKSLSREQRARAGSEGSKYVKIIRKSGKIEYRALR